MGRYATIETNLDKYEVCCSGILAGSIHDVIGKERFEEWHIALTKEEVLAVMMKIAENMSGNCRLVWSDVQERITGYRKLSQLMEWYHEEKGTELTFC